MSNLKLMLISSLLFFSSTYLQASQYEEINDRSKKFKLSNSNKKLEKIISTTYGYLYEKINAGYKKAQYNNKKFLVVLGEDHSSWTHNLIEAMIFNICQKLEIKIFYHESNAETTDYGSLIGQFYYPQSNEDLVIAQKNLMRYHPLEPGADKIIKFSRSVEGIRKRNELMSSTLNKAGKSGVAIMGSNHNIGVIVHDIFHNSPNKLL